MVELISMIKDVHSVMLKMAPLFAESIANDIYRELQEFVQIQLREPVRKSMKHKKTTVRS